MSANPTGLAAERTELAWGRSGLALVVCGAALLRRVAPLGVSGRRPLAGALTLALGLVVWLLSVVYRRRRARTAMADAMTMRLVSYSVAALAGFSFLVSLLPG